MNGGKKRTHNGTIVLIFFLIEITFVLFFFSLTLPEITLAVVGGNVTVTTLLQIGTVAPEILNVSVNEGNAIDLTANATTTVTAVIVARDFNGEDDIQNFTAEFFDNAVSSYGATDDNNNHYTNVSCFIDTTYGDSFEVNATCTFPVEYYANNATWNTTVLVTDNATLTDLGSTTNTINTLLAVGLPDTIDYGEVNATQVSSQQIANVTNFGNVQINLTLEGYAHSQGDGYSFNCTLGTLQNISIDYEKYNLTASNDSILNLSQFENLYTNLTNESVTRTFDLNYRQNDSDQGVDDVNSTYWRVFVPTGVAGSCSGNIIFGATIGPAT